MSVEIGQRAQWEGVRKPTAELDMAPVHDSCLTLQLQSCAGELGRECGLLLQGSCTQFKTVEILA